MITLGNTLSHQHRQSSATSKSMQLLQRAGYVQSTGSGTVAWLALGTALLRQVERVIREELDTLSDEIRLGALQRAELWERSGRIEAFGTELFRVLDRSGHELLLSATAEEAFVEACRGALLSHRNLELHGYQIGMKYRDELRARGGLLRGREFIMKDAYSLHANQARADESYERYRAAYERIFTRCGIETTCIAADTGAMGGSVSHEYLARCSDGDETLGDEAYSEVGHVFQLGDRYTRALGLSYAEADGSQAFALMNCYGIGVSRLVAVMADTGADEHGLTWADELAVADVHVLATNSERRAEAHELALACERAGKRVLFDARDVRAGAAFADADLIGARHIVTVGRDWKNGLVEVKHRRSGQRTQVTQAELLNLA